MSTNIAHLLTQTALWTRPARAGSKGKFVETPVTMDTAAPCRVAPASARDYEIAKQMGATVSHSGYFDAAWSGQPNDDVAVDGRNFRVVARLMPSKTDYHVKALLEERQHGRSG